MNYIVCIVGSYGEQLAGCEFTCSIPSSNSYFCLCIPGRHLEGCLVFFKEGKRIIIWCCIFSVPLNAYKPEQS